MVKLKKQFELKNRRLQFMNHQQQQQQVAAQVKDQALYLEKINSNQVQATLLSSVEEQQRKAVSNPIYISKVPKNYYYNLRASQLRETIDNFRKEEERVILAS
jgi:hypothetical protein